MPLGHFLLSVVTKGSKNTLWCKESESRFAEDFNICLNKLKGCTFHKALIKLVGSYFSVTALPQLGSFTAQLTCRLNQDDRLVVLLRRAVELV